MVNIAVVYKSRYGTTKQYAEWIAKALDAILLEASVVKPSQLASFDIVVYGGGLYAGRIDYKACKWKLCCGESDRSQGRKRQNGVVLAILRLK